MRLHQRYKKIVAQFEAIEDLAKKLRKLERGLPDEDHWSDVVREEEGTPAERIIAAAMWGKGNPDFYDEEEEDVEAEAAVFVGGRRL